MATWANRRKFTYASFVCIVLIVVVGLPIFFTTYHRPTCSDGIRNGDEQGIDCGGSCQRLCQSAYLSPAIPWVKYEKVVEGRYNVAAYIVNPNTNGAALNVPYTFTLYDAEGILITEAAGVTSLSPHRNTVAFVGAVDTGKRIPARVTFEFTKAPLWQKAGDTVSDLAISNKKYTEDASGSSLTATIRNTSLYAYQKVYVFAVLLDSDGNVVGFSRTLIDRIDPGTSQVAPFTWPSSHDGRFTTIEILPIVPPRV